MKRFAGQILFAVALVFAAITLSGSALAQYGYYDNDDYYAGSTQQARQYGFQYGYHDGYRKGRHEGRENDPGDIDVRALQNASHGY